MSIFRSISGFFSSKGGEQSVPCPRTEPDRASVSESESLAAVTDACSGVYGGAVGDVAPVGISSRRTSSASIKSASLSLIGPDIEPPDVDLSHLNEQEQAQIAAVIARARMQMLLDEEAAEHLQTPPSSSSREEFHESTSSVEKVERLCALCGSFIDAEDSVRSLCTACHRPACVECGIVEHNLLKQVSEWLCLECQPPPAVGESVVVSHDEYVVMSAEEGVLPESVESREQLLENKSAENLEREEDQVSHDSQTAENFFETYLVSLGEPLPEYQEHKVSNGSAENGAHNRPQILNLADQSSASQLSPDDEVWLKFMGDILQPSTKTVKEEADIPETGAKSSEDGTDCASSITSATVPPLKDVESLPRVRPSPLDRVSHSSSSDQNQSPSRRSPKSPPSSPSWARYRESPTRSPVSRTRSPQISPCDKHSSKLFEGMFVSMLPVQDNSCSDGTRVQDSSNTTNKNKERTESTNVLHEVQSSEFQGTDLIARQEDYCVDLASYAATVASSTAYLMSMNTSPPESKAEEIAACPASATNPSDGLPVMGDNTELHLPLQSQCWPTDVQQQEVHQSTNNPILLPIQTDWSPPLGDLYPILDVSPSIEKLEQETMFSVGKQPEEGELTVDSEEVSILAAEEEDISEGKSVPSSKAPGIMAPLKRCPSFSNIPSLTSDEEERKLGKLPTELDDLTVYEEKDLLDNRIFDLGDFHGILNKVSIKSDVLSTESVPNITVSSKMFDNFENEQVRCNLLEIEDGSDLYSASSSPEVPSDSYNSIKMNVHALSTELDEQNFILSSDDDQEIDLDEDIPPKHLIGVGRSKGLVNYGSSAKDSDQVNRNPVLVGNNDQLTDFISSCNDARVSRDFRSSAESPDCVTDEMKNEYEPQDKARTVGEMDPMNILHQSQKKEEYESELVVSKKKYPPPRPPPFKMPAAAAAACGKGDSKKAVISFASYISDQGMKPSNSETSSAKEALPMATEEVMGMVNVDPCITLNLFSNSKEMVTSSSDRRDDSVEHSAERMSESDAVETEISEYPTVESLSSTLQHKEVNFETATDDQKFPDQVSSATLPMPNPSGPSSAACPIPDHSSADSSLSWPSLVALPVSDPIVAPSLRSGPLLAASQSELSSVASIPDSSSSVSLPGPSSAASLLCFSSGASLHPATPLPIVQSSSSSANLSISLGIVVSSQASSSGTVLASQSYAVSFTSDSSFHSSAQETELQKVIQAKPKVPPKPLRPKRNEEETSEVYGLKVPVNTHSLHQRVKEEMKIVTAARRLHLDEAGEVRIMEAELEERNRERRMKVQGSARDLVILWGLPDKGTQQDIPKEDEVGLQKFRTSTEKNEESLSATEFSQDVRRISSSTLSLQQRKQSRHHVRHPSDVSSCKKELIEASKPSRRYSQTEEFQPRQMWTGNARLVHDLDDPAHDVSPMMRNSYLSRSSNILDDYSYGSDVVLPNSQSESALPLTCGVDDRPVAFRDLQDRYLKEEKLLKLQMEIEKRRQHLFKLEQAQVDWENTNENPYTSNLPSRQHESFYGVIKPIDYQIDPEKYILRDNLGSWTTQESVKSRGLNPYLEPVYSSYEYLAHKTGQHTRYQDDSSKEFLLEEAFLNLPALSQYDIVDLVSYPDDRLVFNSAQFSDNGTAGVSSISDLYPSSSSCQPLSPFMSYEDVHLPLAFCHQDFTSQRDATPAMSLLDDVTSRTRNILRDIGSRPLSDDMEKYFQVDEPLNMMFRDESEYSVSESADDNVMEGGVTIRMLSNYKNPLSSSLHPSQRYKFETKRILLTPDPKDKSVKENGIGLKIIGGKLLPWSDDELGAYVAAIYPGSVADQLHGELNEGDQVLEWNGERLTGRTYDEVQQIISMPTCEVELVIRPGANLWTKKSSTMSTLRTATDSNRSSYENVQLLSSYNASMDALSAVTVNEPQQSSDPDVLVSHLGLAACMGASTDSMSQDFQRGVQSQEGSSAGSGQTPLSGYEYKSPTSPPSNKAQQQLPDELYDDSVQVSGQTQVYLGEIQLRLNYDDYNGALNVHLVQARDLLPRCKSGYADPLVKVTLMPCRSSHDCKKSKQVLRTLNPEWHQTLIFRNIAHQDLSGGKLEVTVWDRDRYMPDQFMGEVVIDFAESQCLNNRLRWYRLREYSQNRFDQNVQLAVLTSSESGSSAASHANPSNNFDLAPGHQSDSQNSIQSPPQLIGMHPLQIRSVEGGPVQDDPLLLELEEAACKYATAKDNIDLPTHNDSDPEMDRFKGQCQSEAYGLLQGPFLAPDEHGSNSRSNVSTPIDAIFEEVRCHMEERRSPDGHDNKFASSSVLATSLHGFLSSLSCCVRPVTNNGHQQNARSNSQVFSRFLKACGYDVSKLASSSLSTLSNQKKFRNKTDPTVSTIPSSLCLSHPFPCECHLAAMHGSLCTYSSSGSSGAAVSDVHSTSTSSSSNTSSRILSLVTGDSSSVVKSVPSVETDHSNNDHCAVWMNGLQGLAYGQLATLGPGQVLPTSVNLYSRHDVASYCVIGDLILVYKWNTSPVPSLSVCVGQCTRIWDRFLTVHHQREWYVKLYLHAGDNKSNSAREDQTSVCRCCCDPVFNESFDYQTDCKKGYLEASLWMDKDVQSSNEKALGLAVIALEQLLRLVKPNEELRGEYKLLAEHL